MGKYINNLILKFNDLKSKQKIYYLAVIVVVIIAAIFLTNDFSNDDIELNQETSSDIEIPTSDISNSKVFVDISGEVNKPGVYEVDNDFRIIDVIDLAGGLTKKAAIDTINRAEHVSDGQKIVIPKKGSVASSQISASNDLININNASSEELQKINGVGPATAEKIISYRTSNGGFKRIEDLKNVSGIGEKTFEKLKDYVCI